MMYIRPQVEILGDAVSVIGLLSPPKMWLLLDYHNLAPNPAYELDE